MVILQRGSQICDWAIKGSLRFGHSCLLAVFGIVFILQGVQVAGQEFHEKEVQAAFLLNFARFVEWPAGVFPEETAPIVIGVLGSDPVLPHLVRVVQDEKVRSRSLEVKLCRRLQEVRSCHIVFIDGQLGGHLQTTLELLHRQKILTVSDMERFAERGGMVQFRTQNNRVRLVINLAAVRAADLVISSKVLRLAEIVGPAP